jgi:signal transduction histidine kinase
MPLSVPNALFPDARLRGAQEFVVIASTIVMMLGGIVLVAWHLRFPSLIRVPPSDAAMTYNTALCFLFAGVGLSATIMQRSVVALISGSVPFLIGLLTFSEYLLGLDLGIDQALMLDDVEPRAAFPGRMALMTSIGFSISGFSILLMNQKKSWLIPSLQRVEMVGLAGIFITVLGVMTLLLFLTDMRVPYGWGKLGRSMAVSSAVGFILLGTGMLSWVWRRGQVTTVSEIRGLPFIVQAGGITISLLLWQALLVQEHRGLEDTVARTAAHVEGEIASRMEARIQALSRLATRAGWSALPVQKEWAADADMIVRDFPGFQAISWIDTDLRVQGITPLVGNEAVLLPTVMTEPTRRALFEKVRTTQTLSISRTLDLVQGGRGFVVFVPIVREGKFAGIICGGFHAETLFATILHGIAPGYSLVLMNADEELYRRLPDEPALEEEWGKPTKVEFVGTHWQVRMWPQAATVAAQHSLLPIWALGSGFLATTLISVVIALAQESRRRAQAAEMTNRELARENTKRTKAEAEIRALNNELEQRVRERTIAVERANADLQQLAYVSAHDLQEPVRMVSTYTQLLARRYQDKLDAEADHFIGYIIEGASRIHMLLTDLLAYLQLDQSEAEKRDIPCEEILENALGGLKKTITAAAALVTHDPLPTVRGDAMQLTLVFRNLLENALLFRLSTPPRVHVWAEQRDDDWLFAVRDNGIGIEPQYAKQIFFMFERLHTQAEYPGTGMGLTLCQKIIERHGGKIWVESQVGQGATFYFTIPRG